MDTNTLCHAIAHAAGVINSCGCNCGAETITDWLTSFGTVGAVIVALLAPWLKSYILRPKVVLKMDTNDPYYTTQTIGESSSASNVEIKRTIGFVWLGVKNIKSRTFANHCFISLGAIYISRGADPANKKYKLYKQFHPQLLQWDVHKEACAEKFVDIPSNMTHFAKVASISVPRNEELISIETSKGSKNGSKCPSFASIAVSIPDGSKEKCRIVGTCQDILLSVRVAGNDLKGERYFLQIAWNGKSEDDITNPLQNLSLHVLNESEGLSLIDKSVKEVM